jgi:hypothetical protein
VLDVSFRTSAFFTIIVTKLSSAVITALVTFLVVTEKVKRSSLSFLPFADSTESSETSGSLDSEIQPTDKAFLYVLSALFLRNTYDFATRHVDDSCRKMSQWIVQPWKYF